MANPDLNEPVVVQATRIDSTLLPPGFSLPYQLYVIQQGQDFGAVTNKANEAGSGAYDAQVKNEEQDVVLADHEERLDTAEATLINHEERITAAEATLVDHEERITAAEAELVEHEDRITTLEGEVDTLQTDVAAQGVRLTAAEGDIDTLQANSISSAVSTDQNVQAAGGSFLIGSVGTPTTDKLQVTGSSNVSVSYKVAGLQVVGARQTGWTAATGTALLGAFNANQAYTVSAAYTQAEILALAAGLVQVRQRNKALEDLLRTHGLMN